MYACILHQHVEKSLTQWFKSKLMVHETEIPLKLNVRIIRKVETTEPNYYETMTWGKKEKK